MIRRDASSMPAQWILISQIDHALLAGKLAEHWGASGFAPLVPRQEVLWTIDHHDDGWREWDAQPDVDPSNGRPRSFTEMELDDSLRIWTRSIELAAQAGPLQGYAVAGHFSALSRRAVAGKTSESSQRAVGRFLASNLRLMDGAVDCIQPLEGVSDVAARALSQLQFFDALSLWFCCAPPSGVQCMSPPAGPGLTLVPRSPECIELQPWPLGVEELNLEIAGRAVPAASYRNREELAAAGSHSVRLRWRLQPKR